LEEIMPLKGNDMHSEIRCYALPYGAIGLVSHLLTYYTIALLSMGRSPIAPCRKLTSPRIDLCLAILGLLGGSAITIFTIIRCLQRWQFILIAAWKATLSITLGALSIHVAALANAARKRNKRWYSEMPEVFSLDREELIGALWWLVVYVFGTIVGLVGLISLVIHAWGDPVIVLCSKIFGGIAAGVVGLTFLVCLCTEFSGFALAACIVALGALSALYSDWVLAGLAGNLIGVPSSDNTILYFAYFAAKRLPFFSF
ncbi:hypothetical protein K440DRAFT_507730, partial [Wilcoxina mikolae CBS 423.85]